MSVSRLISLNLTGLCFLLAGRLPAQQGDDESQRMTLRGLHHFATHARVQLSGGVPLQPIDEARLRGKLEAALRREGIGVVGETDVRDGTQAELGFQYLVMATRDPLGRPSGFVASACLEASQLVKLQRITASGAPVYAVVPTWHTCGLVAGDLASFTQTMLQKADQQIVRFIQAWRAGNGRESRVTNHES